MKWHDILSCHFIYYVEREETLNGVLTFSFGRIIMFVIMSPISD